MNKTKRKTKLVPFGDECKLRIPTDAIDCSRLGFFDALEYDCFDLVKRYCDALGLEIIGEDGEDSISFDIAKDIQDLILSIFEKAGVRFKFDADDNVSASKGQGVAL